MVELTTFRMFHRAAPARQPDPLPEVPAALPEVASSEVAPPPEIALPEAVAPEPAFPEAASPEQELRVRRRAARIDMRQSGAWGEPETAPPTGPSLAESVAFVSEAPSPVVVVEPEAFALDYEHGEPAAEAVASAEESASVSGAGDEAAEIAPVSAPEEIAEDQAAPLPEALVAEDEPVEVYPVLEPEPSAAGFVEADAEAGHYQGVTESEEATPEASHPHVFEPELAPDDEVESLPDPVAVHQAPPVPITEYLHTVPDQPVEPYPAAESVAKSEVAAPLYSEAPIEEPWPLEPPVTMLNQHTLPIDPPVPLEPESAGASEPLALLDEYRSDTLDLDYRLLGLANPAVCTVTGMLGDATPTPMSVGRAGIYRPDGFRPAPWSGFAYDISPDGRTGLAIGTRILTARGEIPVEDLIPGDAALALRGPALLPIVWIGRSTASPLPVEIAAGAFGPGRPGRSLRVGADHPIFMETMPVAARDLVNGETIRNVESETEELFHVDVGFAEVLLAEGIPLASGSR
jgi:hypothetical protein